MFMDEFQRNLKVHEDLQFYVSELNFMQWLFCGQNVC